MSLRTQAVTLLIVALVSAALAVTFSLGLPIIAALPELGTPIWSVIAPIGGGLAAAALILWRSRSLRQGGDAERLANLPGQTLHVFLFSTLLVLFAGVLVAAGPLLARRPATLIAAAALVGAHATVMRALVQGPLVREMTRLLSRAPGPLTRRQLLEAQQEEGNTAVLHRRRRWLSSVGVLAIRPAVALTSMTIPGVALGVIGVHAYSQSQSELERLADQHLADLLQVTRAEVAQLKPERVRSFIASFPASSRGTPVLVDAHDQVLTLGPGIYGPARLFGGGDCRVGRTSYRCAVGPPGLPGGLRLAVLRPTSSIRDDPALTALRGDLLLLGVALLALAAVLGGAIGSDISRDFQVMANQLAAMSRQDQPDLGKPITVTSVDEVGDLTAALGKLRLRLEEELAGHQQSLRKTREADRIKSMFFSDVSHELRTPLTTICGYSQLLTEGMEGGLTQPQREDMGIILSSGRQLLGLINDVLDISVIESGDLTLSLEKVDLVAVCREIVRAQSPIARRKSEGSGKPLELKLETAEDAMSIVADPLRLRQIVHNLLSNALKFTDEGSITISVRRDGAEVRMEVRDTGVGISGAEIEQVFERYLQVGSLKSRRQGSGLGLGICRHLVELHGGRISVESEVARGSTFVVLLPAAGPPPGAQRREAAA